MIFHICIFFFLFLSFYYYYLLLSYYLLYNLLLLMSMESSLFNLWWFLWRYFSYWLLKDLHHSFGFQLHSIPSAFLLLLSSLNFPTFPSSHRSHFRSTQRQSWEWTKWWMNRGTSLYWVYILSESSIDKWACFSLISFTWFSGLQCRVNTTDLMMI